MNDKPLIDSSQLLSQPWKSLYAPFQGTLESLLGIARLNELHALGSKAGTAAEAFSEAALKDMGVSWSLDEAEINRLKSIPGPLLIVANHPFGSIEALWLFILLSHLGRDYRVMANSLLLKIEALKENLIGVNPFGGGSATAQNLGPLKKSLAWLKSGGVLAAFPAGEVASFSLRQRGIVEAPWSQHIGRLAEASGATVVPIYFPGHNGLGFQAAGLIHARLRSLMLLRSGAYPAVTSLNPKIGPAISLERLKRLSKGHDLSASLRQRTLLLAAAGYAEKMNAPDSAQAEPLAAPQSPESLQAEVETLRVQGRVLVFHDDFEVLSFKKQEAPSLMLEIGRLREESFRAAGEGTGKSLDLDAYDDAYVQLVLWDRQNQRLAGAYRIGHVNELVASKGLNGLYSASLFKMQPSLLDELSDALELGRSFVANDYQKGFAPLFLLWKGIASYVARLGSHPKLFGCVSISPRFMTSTQRLMVRFLNENSLHKRLSAWVRPRNPDASVAQSGPGEFLAGDLKEMEGWVEELEQGRLKIPPLLKQYLKLGGKILAFNRDPAFNGTLDALIFVDLRLTQPKLLERYMGPEASAQFLKKSRP